MMRIQLIALFLVSTIFATMCGGSKTEEKPTNKDGSTETTKPASNEPTPEAPIAAPVTPTPVPTTEAVTLKPLVEAYCKALRNSDEAALRKLYSAASLKRLDADARNEGEKSIVDYLNNSEPVGNTCRVINETIDGNLAEANVITESYAGPNGIRWVFVKENGEWKMTTESSDFDKVKKQ